MEDDNEHDIAMLSVRFINVALQSQELGCDTRYWKIRARLFHGRENYTSRNNTCTSINSLPDPVLSMHMLIIFL